MDEIGHAAITMPPGGIACSEIVQCVMMSEYLQKLDRIARERYIPREIEATWPGREERSI